MKGDFSRLTFDPRKQYSAVLMQQGRVQVDADWNEQQAIDLHRLGTETRDVVGLCGAPFDAPGFQIGVQASELTIGAGRYYAGGLLCENDTLLLYSAQPHLISQPGQAALPSAAEILAQANATRGIVYLDAWTRHLTALDDGHIREVALGGPDTATRLQTIWQVKVLPISSLNADQLPFLHCGTVLAEWEQLTNPGPQTAGLQARTQAPEDDEGPCVLPPSAGYQRLENQLYRVEIHQGGALGVATFKWSRDNGSVVTAIEAPISGTQVTVQSVGPDDVLGFANGQWVEVLDDRHELNGLPGQLVQIDDVNPATRVITLATAPAAVDMTRHPKLRRWDSAGALTVETPAANDGYLTLEGGIEIHFEPGAYRTGDYWLIPARTATGDIEWPPFDDPDAAPALVEPLRDEHHYCRLALIQRNPQTNAITVLSDCRRIFPPLAASAMRVITTSWENDTSLSLGQFFETGLEVRLDGEPVAATVDGSTVIVTLETPIGLGTAGTTTGGAAVPEQAPDLILILDGQIQVQANRIRWRPSPPSLQEALIPLLQTGPRRVRVTLKGHTIWTVRQGRLLYLDGQAFGRPEPGLGEQGLRTALILPTGDGFRASDFESWFFLVGQAPPAVTTLRVTTVRWVRVNNLGQVEAVSTAQTVTVPPLPPATPFFRASEQINAVEVTFNRPVSEQGFGTQQQPHSIRVERLTQITPGAGLPTFINVPGILTRVTPNLARFRVTNPEIFVLGSWRLIAQGQASQLGPPVTALDDNTPVDGDFTGQPGGDFILPFNAT